MSEPRRPLDRADLEIIDEGNGYWISPGAARKLRRRAWGIAMFIILLGMTALIAWDARDTATTARSEGRQEVLDRIAAIAQNSKQNCMAINNVAVASKAVASGTGAALTQNDVERVNDPQIRALLQIIVSRSADNQARIRELGEKIPILDCDAQARRAARH